MSVRHDNPLTLAGTPRIRVYTRKKPTMKLEGLRFGKMLILKRTEGYIGHSPAVLCRCDCGNEKTVAYGNLKNGVTTSCGCVHKQMMRDKGRGHKGTPVYEVWVSMRHRCRNPNAKGYSYYGGRGIKVCERWDQSYENFLADMGPRPDGYSIDRIDVNGNYCPENCRWATSEEQGVTTRKTIRVHHKGKDYSSSRFADKCGVSRYKTMKLAKEGLSGEQIIERLKGHDPETPALF